MRPSLLGADCVAVVTATGARRRILRMHYTEDAPSAETTFFARRQIETLLSSSTEKTFQRAAGKACAEEQARAEEGLPALLTVNEAELALLKSAKVRCRECRAIRGPGVAGRAVAQSAVSRALLPRAPHATPARQTFTASTSWPNAAMLWRAGDGATWG